MKILSYFSILGISKIILGVIVARIVLSYAIETFINTFLYKSKSRNSPSRRPEGNIKGKRSPSEYGWDYEELNLRTKDEVLLHGWFIKQAKDAEHCPTFIMFHGIGGNIGARLPYIKHLYEKSHVNVIIIDYRGYGNSQGSPSEKGIEIDAETTLDWALDNPTVDNSKIFIHGRSLGGGVAINLCSKRQNDIQGLIIENTFKSFNHVASGFLPSILKLIPHLLCRRFWPSIKHIKHLRIPILFVSGRKDRLISYKQMDELYDKAVKSVYKIKCEIPNGKHGGTWKVDLKKYFKYMNEFLSHSLELTNKN